MVERDQKSAEGAPLNLDGRPNPALLGESFAPRPEALQGLIKLDASPELLELDPTGTLAHFLNRGNSSPQRESLSDQLFKVSASIVKHMERNGLPRNPDNEVVLRELFSPKLLRQGITRALECSLPTALAPVVALSFIYHPIDTLDEIRFMSRQLIRSPRQKEVWKEVAKGLIGACELKPERWTALAPGQRRYLKGPDFLDPYFEKLSYKYLLTLPAFVVEKALSLRSPIKKESAEDLVNTLTNSPVTFLEMPGLLPLLRHVRESHGILPECLTWKIIGEIKSALTVRGDASPLTKWMRAHRSGEPARREEDGETLVRAFIEELLEFSEFRAAMLPFGTDHPEVFAGIRQARLKLFQKAHEVISEILRRDPDFRNDDINEIVDALESYEEKQLRSSLTVGERVLAGAKPPLLCNSGCELAIKFASLGLNEHPDLTTAFSLHAQSKADPIYEVVIRVKARQAPHAELATLLNSCALDSFWPRALKAWHLLPPGHDATLFRSLLVRGALIGLPMEEMTRGCTQWGGLSADEIAELCSRPQGWLGTSTDDHMAVFLNTLSKITITDSEFVKWRSSLVERILTDPGANRMLLPDHTEVIIPLLYEGALTQEIQESSLATGQRTNMCFLRLSVQQERELSDESRKVLRQVNQWMNGAFSDYALERGLFTSASILLEGYGQTRRTLKDLLFVLKNDLRANPTSVGTQRVLSAIVAFQRARRRGENLERLRRRLAIKGLLQYEERDVPLIAATETGIRRLGLKGEARPLVNFASLMLLGRIRSVGRYVQYKTRNSPVTLRAIRRPKEEFEQLVSECRTALESELTFKSQLSFPRMLKIPAEQRHLMSLFGKMLLGGALAFGGGAALRSLGPLEWMSGDSGVHFHPADDLRPNGRIPKVEKPIAKLSKPFKNARNQFLVQGLVGASESKAQQPGLSYEGSHEVHQWLRYCGADDLEDLVEIELPKLRRDDFVALPIGAVVLDATSTLASGTVPVRAARDAAPHHFEMMIAPERPIDSTLTGADIVTELGLLHQRLSQPRLPPWVIRDANPELAEAIEKARSMTAVHAVAFLRKKVSKLLIYEEAPIYNDFEGSFEEYFRTILGEEKGICGQSSVVFDEVLKQAGIPCCITLGLLPKEDGVTYTTAGGHATNVVFLLSADGKKAVVPRIYDATGEAAPKEESNDELERVALKGSLAIGGAGVAALLIIRRQRRRAELLENAALESARCKTDPPEETLPTDEASIEVEAEPSAPGVDPEVILSQWVLHHLQQSESSRPDNEQEWSLEDIEALDIDSALKAVEDMKADLMQVTPRARFMLSKAGLLEYETTIGIANGWLRSMEDSARRREWIQHIQHNVHFTPQEAQTLLLLAREVVPAFKEEVKGRSLLQRLNQLSRAAPLDVECLLRALSPWET